MGRKTKQTSGPTPEMLRAAAAAYLGGMRCTLFGRAFDIINEDMDLAVDFVSEVVEGVLGELTDHVTDHRHHA